MVAPNRRFEECLALLARLEGGYVNDPSDPGGATNLGVTRKTWADWTGRKEAEVPLEEMRSLTLEDAAPLYFARYWSAVRADDLPAGLDFAAFNYAVHLGPRRAVRALQDVLGVEVDGAIGRLTLAAAGRLGRDALSAAVDRYVDAYADTLRAAPTWKTYAKGYLNRIAKVRSLSRERVGAGLTVREAAGTDTVKAATAVAAGLATASAIAKDLRGAVEAVAPALAGLHPGFVLAFFACIAVAGVVMWRKRRT